MATDGDIYVVEPMEGGHPILYRVVDARRPDKRVRSLRGDVLQDSLLTWVDACSLAGRLNENPHPVAS